MSTQPTKQPLTRKEYIGYYKLFADELNKILSIDPNKWKLINEFDIVNVSSNTKEIKDAIKEINAMMDNFNELIKRTYERFNTDYDLTATSVDSVEITTIKDIKKNFFHVSLFYKSYFNNLCSLVEIDL